jgi:hypothetical protein
MNPQAPATGPIPWSVPLVNNGAAASANAQAPSGWLHSPWLRYQLDVTVTPTRPLEGDGRAEGEEDGCADGEGAD